MRQRRASITAGVGIVAVALLGLASPANAIANGDPVKPGRYAFSVKLTMTGIPTADGGKRNSACSGALVSSQWIITAGHCFRDANGVRVERPVADSTVATIGRTDLTDTTKGHDLEIVEVRQSPTADVSLAKLAEPVRDIRPIKVSGTAPEVGTVLRLTGYGSTTSSNPAPVTWLRTGQLEVVGLTATVTQVKGHAPQADTTPCPYDSGGPFFVERGRKGPALVAVVSNGPSCPHSSIESAARVDNIADWVAEVTH
ncbi:S1 family peptidase [Actinoplanes solisilvae]|uniref:S1 family peptidase n=1 Tax=Actinoplanes solisilvae TaxID=2486853 RepID=UPI000FDC57E2|nr:trypsin-like serine protease [Actinoplanes solisilvae]